MLASAQIEKIRKSLNAKASPLPAVFGALSDQGRYRIFLLLLRNKGLCVTDISRILNISVPAASQQFKILEKAGLVFRERMGQMTCYSLDEKNPIVKSIIKLLP